MIFPELRGTINDYWDRTLRRPYPTIIILSVGAILHGLYYLPVVASPNKHIPSLEAHLPLYTWTMLWITSGSIALTCGILRRAQAFASGMLALIPGAFALIYSAAWLTGDNPHGFINATMYATVWYLIASRFSVVDPGGQK